MHSLDLLIDRGLSVTADGERLIVSPADRLDDETRAFIREHKPEILESLRDTVHRIPMVELRDLAGPDWAMCEADPALLEAFASAVSTRQMRERGEIPLFYSATTTCRHCGPVPIWPECPPTVEGCPWCFNRVAGKPIPSVT